MWKYIFAWALVIALLAIYWSSTQPVYQSMVTKADHDYDFIIVGGGTAGCVLASELSADPEVKVLLIEAGGLASWISRIPLLAPLQLVLDSLWHYRSVPQKQSHEGFHDQISMIPRGKILGGTGHINFYIHNVSEPETNPKIAEALHTPHTGALLNSFLKAQARHPYGIFSPISSLQREGQRVGVLDIFLKPALNRRNLHVLINSEVEKLGFEQGRVGKIIVVQKLHHFNISTTSKTKVILSGGAINTPVILLRSGIGPRHDLEELKIPVVKDVPTGHHLTDHISMPLYFHVNSTLVQEAINTGRILNPWHMWEYWRKGTGGDHWSTSSRSSGVITSSLLGFWASTHILGQVHYKENGSMALLYGMGAPNIHAFTHVSNMKQEVFTELFPNHDDLWAEGFIFLALCLDTRSKGQIRLGLKSPPGGFQTHIDPAFLADPRDLECMKNIIHKAIDIGNSMTEVEARYHLPRFPNCLVHELVGIENEDYLECLIRTAAMTMYHPMGSASHPAFLGPDLRAKGLANLYIVDASAIPALPNQFPNQATIQLALDFAQQWRQSKS